MKWDQITGQWHPWVGRAKSAGAKLSDDDLKQVAGKIAQLVGKRQAGHGLLRDKAERQGDAWTAKIRSEPKGKV